VENLMTDAVTGKRTALSDLHLGYGAKMVPFAGWSMPVQYSTGVTAEHLHTRSAVSLFDVSHMGQISVQTKGFDGDENDVATVAEHLERVLPGDIVGMAVGQQKYSMLTTSAGTILDDLMITRRAHDFLLVVNAANTTTDLAHLQRHLGSHFAVTHLVNRGLVALQGPLAATILRRCDALAGQLRFLEGRELVIAGAPCYATRSGYTGEDGFEIGALLDDIGSVASELLTHPEVQLAGLGARDTLRLEAGLCLHGHDISESTTPLEAMLGWSISQVRRPGGARPGGYLGSEVIDRQRADGVSRRRVGFLVDGRVPVREGSVVFSPGGDPCGVVTSGTTTPSMGRPIAMGYVDTASVSTEPGTKLLAEVRGRRIELEICSLPFIPHRYAR
jgi:aminomethyltransferase